MDKDVTMLRNTGKKRTNSVAFDSLIHEPVSPLPRFQIDAVD